MQTYMRASDRDKPVPTCPTGKGSPDGDAILDVNKNDCQLRFDLIWVIIETDAKKRAARLS